MVELRRLHWRKRLGAHPAACSLLLLLLLLCGWDVQCGESQFTGYRGGHSAAAFVSRRQPADAVGWRRVLRARPPNQTRACVAWIDCNSRGLQPTAAAHTVERVLFAAAPPTRPAATTCVRAGHGGLAQDLKVPT
jgi:hypothetical protein